MANIGEPKRIIEIVPLKEPVSVPEPESVPAPGSVPEHEPQEVPA